MNDPYLLYGRLYEKTASDEALDYLISTSILRGYDEDALSYLAEAKSVVENSLLCYIKNMSFISGWGMQVKPIHFFLRL